MEPPSRFTIDWPSISRRNPYTGLQIKKRYFSKRSPGDTSKAKKYGLAFIRFRLSRDFVTSPLLSPAPNLDQLTMSPENEQLRPRGFRRCVGLARSLAPAPILWHSPPIGACHKIGPATSGPSPAVCGWNPRVEDQSMPSRSLSSSVPARSSSFRCLRSLPLRSASIRNLSRTSCRSWRDRESISVLSALERGGASNRNTEGGSGETTRADGGRAVPLGHGGALSFCIDPGAMISMAPLIRSLVCFYLLLSNLNVWLRPRLWPKGGRGGRGIMVAPGKILFSAGSHSLKVFLFQRWTMPSKLFS